MTKFPELTTIRDYIRFATSQFNEAKLFFGHGTDNAWDEASALILTALHLPHDINPTILDAHLIQQEKDHLLNLIDLRITKRIPVAYLTHEAWFFGLPFYVDERVLIPRSPIAELISQHFEPWIDSDRVTSILDLCTGSGCIAIACAKTFPEAEVFASDVSLDALSVAEINVNRHEVNDQVTLIQSDLFQNIPLRQFDIIVSNPPYVSSNEMQTLPTEYLHEPQLGLHANNNGLEIALRILKSAKTFLKPNGILIVEVGNSEYYLREQHPEIPFTWLEFENGGGGVFLLTHDQLTAL